MITLVEGERIRLRQAMERMRAVLDSTDLVIEARNVPPSPSDAQSVLEAAGHIVMGIAKLEAYMRAEERAAKDAAELRQQIAVLEEQANPEAFLR